MARSTFRRDSQGIDALLKSSEFAGVVTGLANAIAADVRGRRPEAEVVVDEYTTDRAAASVTVKHREALRWQAENGDLTSAAAAQGLDVRERAE